MIINHANLSNLFTGYKSAFVKGFSGAPSTYEKIATVVPSASTDENYGWLGQFSRLREWVGDRHIRNLTAHSYSIVNRTFEDTVEVERTKIEDDRYGVYAPAIEDMGRAAALHPDELVYTLLGNGFATTCYDGQYFFDEEHPVGSEGDTPVAGVSNMQAGSGPAWFLLDTSRPLKPMIFQKRMGYDFQRVDQDSDQHVFMKDKFLYGLRARANAGYGFWQMAFGSKAPLTPANFELAVAAMGSLRSDVNRPLGIRPTHLVVPVALEGAARRLLKGGSRIETVEVGESEQAVAVSNEWTDAVELIVTPFL